MQEYISKFTGAEIDARLENTINVYDNLDSLETSAVKDGSIATCCFDDVVAMKLSETNVVTEQDTNDSFDILNPENITSGITGIEVIAPSEIYSSIERAMVIFVSEDHDMNTNPEIIMISTNTNNNSQPYWYNMFIGSPENDVLIGGNGNSYVVNSEAVLKINNALSNGKKWYCIFSGKLCSNGVYGMPVSDEWMMKLNNVFTLFKKDSGSNAYLKTSSGFKKLILDQDLSSEKARIDAAQNLILQNTSSINNLKTELDLKKNNYTVSVLNEDSGNQVVAENNNMYITNYSESTELNISFDIPTSTTSPVLEFVFYIKNVTAITYPSNVKWANGVIPKIYPEYSYELHFIYISSQDNLLGVFAQY